MSIAFLHKSINLLPLSPVRLFKSLFSCFTHADNETRNVTISYQYNIWSQLAENVFLENGVTTDRSQKKRH